MLSKLSLVPPLFLLSITLTAQTPPPSDPQALSYAAQSISAMTGGTTINDVTLTGNATWSGNDSGTATLEALGTAESRMDLALSAGTRSEVRDAQTGSPIGQWENPNNVSGPFAIHNCWTDAVWFFPPLSSLAGGQNVVLSYIGQEDRNGNSVQHLQSYIYQPASTPPPGPQQLSAMDFYLDSSTLLPVAITFSAHPDDDATTNLLIEVDFANYQSVNGVLVPMHIQRYSQGNLSVDLTISGASFNTGLSLSDFSIN